MLFFLKWLKSECWHTNINWFFKMGHRFCGMVFCNVIIVFLVMDMQCKSKNNFVSNIDKCKQIEKKQKKNKTNKHKQTNKTKKSKKTT